jgi:hypothetical protein
MINHNSYATYGFDLSQGSGRSIACEKKSDFFGSAGSGQRWEQTGPPGNAPGSR